MMESYGVELEVLICLEMPSTNKDKNGHAILEGKYGVVVDTEQGPQEALYIATETLRNSLNLTKNHQVELLYFTVGRA